MYPIFYSNSTPYKSIVLHRALSPFRIGLNPFNDGSCRCVVAARVKTGRKSGIPRRPGWIKFLVVLGLGVISSTAFAEVGLKVDSQGKTDYGAARSESKKQIRVVSATVSNSGKSEMQAVEVRWAIYGKTMNGNKLVEITSGSETKNIPAGGNIEVSSPEVTISGAREHSVASGGGRRARYKEVPASGERYYGFAVEVYVGGKMVISQYEQPSIKNLRQNVP